MVPSRGSAYSRAHFVPPHKTGYKGSDTIQRDPIPQRIASEASTQKPHPKPLAASPALLYHRSLSIRIRPSISRLEHPDRPNLLTPERPSYRTRH